MPVPALPVVVGNGTLPIPPGPDPDPAERLPVVPAPALPSPDFGASLPFETMAATGLTTGCGVETPLLRSVSRPRISATLGRGAGEPEPSDRDTVGVRGGCVVVVGVTEPDGVALRKRGTSTRGVSLTLGRTPLLPDPLENDGVRSIRGVDETPEARDSKPREGELPEDLIELPDDPAGVPDDLNELPEDLKEPPDDPAELPDDLNEPPDDLNELPDDPAELPEDLDEEEPERPPRS